MEKETPKKTCKKTKKEEKVKKHNTFKYFSNKVYFQKPKTIKLFFKE